MDGNVDIASNDDLQNGNLTLGIAKLFVEARLVDAQHNEYQQSQKQMCISNENKLSAQSEKYDNNFDMLNHSPQEIRAHDENDNSTQNGLLFDTATNSQTKDTLTIGYDNANTQDLAKNYADTQKLDQHPETAIEPPHTLMSQKAPCAVDDNDESIQSNEPAKHNTELPEFPNTEADRKYNTEIMDGNVDIASDFQNGNLTLGIAELFVEASLIDTQNNEHPPSQDAVENSDTLSPKDSPEDLTTDEFTEDVPAVEESCQTEDAGATAPAEDKGYSFWSYLPPELQSKKLAVLPVFGAVAGGVVGGPLGSFAGVKMGGAVAAIVGSVAGATAGIMQDGDVKKEPAKDSISDKEGSEQDNSGKNSTETEEVKIKCDTKENPRDVSLQQEMGITNVAEQEVVESAADEAEIDNELNEEKEQSLKCSQTTAKVASVPDEKAIPAKPYISTEAKKQIVSDVKTFFTYSFSSVKSGFFDFISEPEPSPVDDDSVECSPKEVSSKSDKDQRPSDSPSNDNTNKEDKRQDQLQVSESHERVAQNNSNLESDVAKQESALNNCEEDKVQSSDLVLNLNEHNSPTETNNDDGSSQLLEVEENEERRHVDSDVTGKGNDGKDLDLNIDDVGDNDDAYETDDSLEIEEEPEESVENERFLQKMSKYRAAAYPVAGAVVGTVVGGPFGLALGLKLGSMGAFGATVTGYLGEKIIAEERLEQEVAIPPEPGHQDTSMKSLL